MADYIYNPTQMKRIADDLKEGKSVEPVSVRELLYWFGAQRRGYYVTEIIHQCMINLGIATNPDFESIYIDTPVRFRLVSNDDNILEVDNANDPIPAEDFDCVEAGEEYITGAISNPTYQVSRLEAANHEPVYVNPDLPLEEAVMLMIMHDYSQLPVMSSPRAIKGMISWVSIGTALALKKKVTHVRDCIETAHEVRYDESLFSAINRIVQYGYVLVKNEQNLVGGIITASDLSVQLRQLSEPFLLIGEIENHIRRIIDGKFTVDELSDLKDPADSERVIDKVSDLTFGEYVRVVQKEERWNKLNLSIPRASFVKQLDEVREIRNDVMHFDPDGLPQEQLDKLRNFVRLLQTLQQFGAIK
ncbi:hypothetical protein IAD21_03113 [Abditibacteriota bacterium]|nr:hypothetical protein IAD21_03113 [Abditibacteriota bacterium]